MNNGILFRESLIDGINANLLNVFDIGLTRVYNEDCPSLFNYYNSQRKSLIYPIEEDDIWFYSSTNSTYEIICEEFDTVESSTNQLYAISRYQNINSGCFEVKTDASLPNIADDLNFTFVKKYCSNGIESVNQVYNLGTQIMTDEAGSEINSFTPKIFISLELLETDIIQ
jgi:hypothetical protein